MSDTITMLAAILCFMIPVSSLGEGGQTKDNISGWTTDTLKEHTAVVDTFIKELFSEADRRYELRFNAQEKSAEAALHSTTTAVNKAEASNEKRFESVNEFRQTLSDQTKSFITRTEAIQNSEANKERITALAARLDAIDGRSAGLNSGWIMMVQVFSVIAVLIAVASFFARRSRNSESKT